MTSEQRPQRANRKRGVKASRSKLQKAMYDAGFKTQVAVADRIAEQEGIETTPKDMVNKVFRQVPVSPRAIERVAAALGVDAYTLYLSQQENDSRIEQPETDISHQAASSYVSGQTVQMVFAILLMLIPLIAVLQSFIGRDLPHQTNNEMVSALGQPSLAIYAHNSLHPLFESVTFSLAENFNLVPSIQSAPDLNESDVYLHQLERQQVDHILFIGHKRFGRHWFLYADLLSHNSNKRIWQSVYSTEHKLTSSNWYEVVSHQLQSAIFKPNDHHIVGYPQQAWELFLQGRDLLDKSSTATNAAAALSRFSLATELYPDFAPGYVGKCLAMINESWMGNEKRLLTQAQVACDKARTLNDYATLLKVAEGFLLRRTGRVEQAVEDLTVLTDQLLDDEDLYLELANAEFELYRQQPQEFGLLEQARKHAVAAQSLAPDYWKPYHLTGIIEWTAGNKQASIDAFTTANNIQPNELLLTNLGTMNFCIGNRQQAKTLFSQSIEMSPDAHYGFEMLGMLSYFEGDYEKSIDYRKKAVQLAGDAGIHQMWGSLADSYLKNKQWQEAQAAYEHALLKVNNDFARGNVTSTERAHRLYYLSQLAVIQHTSDTFRHNEQADLSTLQREIDALEPSSLLRLAQVHQVFGDNRNARTFLNKASDVCVVYKQHPDFTTLLTRQ